MSAPELIEQLRRDARFQMLPLLNSTGDAVGLHFHRFSSGYIHLVQAWEDNDAASACVPNVPNMDLFGHVPAIGWHVGTFTEVASRFLPLVPRHRRDAASQLNHYKGEFGA